MARTLKKKRRSKIKPHKIKRSRRRSKKRTRRKSYRRVMKGGDNRMRIAEGVKTLLGSPDALAMMNLGPGDSNVASNVSSELKTKAEMFKHGASAGLGAALAVNPLAVAGLAAGAGATLASAQAAKMGRNVFISGKEKIKRNASMKACDICLKDLVDYKVISDELGELLIDNYKKNRPEQNVVFLNRSMKEQADQREAALLNGQAPMGSTQTLSPAAVAVEPDPAAVAPDPAAVAPAAVAVAPAAVAVAPEVAPEVAPDPAAVAPEVAPDPAAVSPEVAPDPAAVSPEVAPDPAAVAPEVAPDPAAVAPEVAPDPAAVAPDPAAVSPEVAPDPAAVSPEVAPEVAIELTQNQGQVAPPVESVESVESVAPEVAPVESVADEPLATGGQ